MLQWVVYAAKILGTAIVAMQHQLLGFPTLSFSFLPPSFADFCHFAFPSQRHQVPRLVSYQNMILYIYIYIIYIYIYRYNISVLLFLTKINVLSVSS